VEESFSSEHSGELFSNSLEHFLDGGGVTHEGNGHLESFRGDITNGGFDVIGNPFNEVRRVLVLDVEHLFVDFFSGHSSSEKGRGGKISSVSGVSGTHHVFGVEHLLGKFGDGEGSVLLGSSGGKGGKSDHEEMESGERDKIDGEFSQVTVKLTGESEAGGNSGHGSGDQVVKITISGGGEFKGSETDIVKGFVINDEDHVGIFDQLMDGKGGIVWFNNGVRDFGGGDNGESFHNSVGVFFSDLGDQKSSHTGSSSSSEGVGDLESLEAITSFGFFSADIKDGVNEFSSFSVMSFGPIVTSSSLSENEVIGSEELSERSGSNGVHGTGFKIHKDGSGNVSSSSGFIEVDVDSFQLEVGVSVVSSGGVNSMFVRDDFPEFGSDLISALSSLYVNDLSHFVFDI
jgi:hypothetical protein